MKSPAIPEFVDPTKSCDKKLTYIGVVGHDKLPRFLALQSIDNDTASLIEVEISFRRDEQNRKIASLLYRTVAKLTCQRCLDVMEMPLEGSATFVFCRNDRELEQAPKSYEPSLLTGNELNLWQILEDELLLSLPMFANHPDVHCNEVLNAFTTAAEKQIRANPFAVLGELLKK